MFDAPPSIAILGALLFPKKGILMKRLHVLCLLFLFPVIHGMDPDHVVEIKIEFLGDEIVDQSGPGENSDYIKMKLSDAEICYQAWTNKSTEDALAYYSKVKSALNKEGYYTNDNAQAPKDEIIESIVQNLISKSLDPNDEGDEGDTILHTLMRQIDINSIHQINQIKLLLMYGANLEQKNASGETPYEIAEKRKLNIQGKWEDLDEEKYPGWQENHNYLPPYISHRYRYASEHEKNGKIVVCIVHGTGFTDNQGPSNRDYYELQSEGFQDS